jgi:hypothetical protein
VARHHQVGLRQDAAAADLQRGLVIGTGIDLRRLVGAPPGVRAGHLRRFAKELKKERGIDVQWRVLDKSEAFKRHDRIILSKDQAKNLPPLNTILAGSVGEILPSDIGPQDSGEWWDLGTDLASFTVEPAAAAS